jgi:hypothetical protein
LGGGGAGAVNSSAVAGTAGTANLGGGGGGGSFAGGNGGAGGSGVIILSYPDTYPAATSVTGSPTITASGGFRIYKFTATGSITF